MDNLDFLKQILTSGCEYWIAAKREYEDYSTGRQGPDSIWFIAIPLEENMHIQRKEDEILLKDIERLRSISIHNIALSENYPPFQHGQSLFRFYKGYPIKENFKEVLKKALELSSNNIYDYEKLLQTEATIV